MSLRIWAQVHSACLCYGLSSFSVVLTSILACFVAANSPHRPMCKFGSQKRGGVWVGSLPQHAEEDYANAFAKASTKPKGKSPGALLGPAYPTLNYTPPSLEPPRLPSVP